nr:PIN domain-containing protein [Aggregatilinea lenta]
MSASIPLNGRLLLDTNAVIALFASDTGLQQILESAEVFLTSIVIGELYYGAQNSRQTEQKWRECGNLSRLTWF